jgi:hypothetical protein
MRGLFQLQSPRDLLAKLRHDYERLQQTPNDAYVAFDFFVTAEHLLDWLYPGAGGRTQRTAERNSQIILQVVSHLATGAKHMIPEDPRHTSVQHADVAPSTYGDAQYSTGVYGAGHLVVELEGAAASQLGGSITPFRLAAKVLEYWQSHTQLK